MRRRFAVTLLLAILPLPALGIDSGGQHRLRATVRILAAEFVGPSGKGVRLSRPIVLTAVVGGWSG